MEEKWDDLRGAKKSSIRLGGLVPGGIRQGTDGGGACPESGESGGGGAKCRGC